MPIPLQVKKPTQALLDLAITKMHLRESGTHQDSYIQFLISAVTSKLDGYSGILGRCLIDQDWSIQLDDLKSRAIKLPFPNVSAATVSFINEDGVAIDVDPEIYQLVERHSGAQVQLKNSHNWPSEAHGSEEVSVTFTAGYGSADDVPDAIKLAALLILTNHYENRESVVLGTIAVEVPQSADNLLAPYRLRST
ncbi:head-tail connector protein [Pseudovibrio ascidiaceicola]|uniref:head-tail connector protein n=1 Tax=Pseudovibrio ascidiaceicola TaxID=285279 RepID=UPI003D36BA1A